MNTASSRQRGIAVVMLLLLVGLGLAALLAGSMHQQQGQAQMVDALRGNSEAQLRAWTGVDLTRQYLAGLTADQQKALEQNGVEIALNSGNAVLNNNIKIKVLKGDVGDGFLTAAITGLSDGASSTIEAVYKLGGGGGGGEDPAVINLIGGLSTSGDITIQGAPNATVQVHGDVNTSGSITGASALNATGNISFSGQPPTDGSLALWSNGNIAINSGQFLELKARGDISMGGGSNVDKAWANGKIASGGDRVGTLWSRTDVELKSAVKVPTELRALGNLIASNNAQLSNCQVGGSANVTADRCKSPVSGLQVQEVPIVSVSKPKIDANNYRPQANYELTLDPNASGDSWQRIRVRVASVSGIADGTYLLCKGASGDWQHNSLCAPGNPSPVMKLCSSEGGGCLDYQNDSWKLGTPANVDGAQLAPGLWFFNGNAQLSGRLHASILASGHIETSGDSLVWSLQQAGASLVCARQPFPAPSSHCDAQGLLKPQPIQSVALMAGSFQGEAFSGGDIKIGAMSRIYGRVVAGNRVQTGGSSHIYGTVTSALQSFGDRLPPDIQNTLGAETVIDASQFGGGGSGGSKPGGANGATLLWTRYK